MAESVYCGPVPLPATLWTNWNLDPPLLLALAGLIIGVAMTGARSASARVVLAGGIATLVVAFVSPLCALATALFSARVVHHVLMIAVAAPLLALAAPRWRVPVRVPLVLIAAGHAFVVWFWHAPAPYAWALSGTAPYWLMELSLMLSAFWLWSEIMAPSTRAGAGLAALLATVVQMGLLGAILTFARAALYDFHAGTTAPFGLTQFEDQQLAGLIMWVPASIPYLIAAGLIVARMLPEEASEARGRDA